MTARAVVLSSARTPIGRFGGALADRRPDDLAALALSAAVDRAGIDPAQLDDVYMGCGNQAGEDNRNVARMALLLAGFPVEVPGSTVNRLCGSGMEAVATAARTIAAGEGELLVAGGVESMTRAPWVVGKTDRPYARGPQQMEDTALGWRFVNPALAALKHTDSLGQTAENVARIYDISRSDQDRFALHSHRKAAARGVPADLVPVETSAGLVVVDEGPRPDASLESLARLRPVFATDGTVTAGNASPLSDGAAALVLASDAYAGAHGLPVRASILGTATAGLEPRVMGMGPVPATDKLLGRLGLTLEDLDVIELNEAFASQAVAVLRAWEIDPEDERVNAAGGAIALGHPIGCSGARLVGRVVDELERRDGHLGLATMCIGVGQGIAVVVERER